jgi:hypothetical protein
MRRHFGALSLGGTRRHLTVLATGDSMIYPVSEELAIGRPPGMRVITDRHDGTGLTTTTVNWHALARRQVARWHPAATVITLGGRDGGIPLADAAGHLIECCGNQWLALYAALLRPLAVDYLQGGRGSVYWLMIPAPREKARAPFYEAVDNAIRLLASEIGPAMHVIPVDTVVSPAGFQSTMTYEGLTIAPRSPDGIHLSHAGACVERSLVTEAMIADGQLTSSADLSRPAAR